MKAIRLVLLNTFFLFLFIFFSGNLRAELVGEVYYDGINPSVQTSDFPIYKAKIRVKYNNSYVALDKSHFVIVHENYPVEINGITAQNAQNWQEISWVAIPTNYSLIDFYITYSNETIHLEGRLRPGDMKVVQVRSKDDQVIQDHDFGIISPGYEKKDAMFIKAPTTTQIDGKDQPVRVDEIIVPEPFSYVWLAAGTPPPPTELTSGFQYQIFLKYTPTVKEYTRKQMIVKYEGNMKTYVNLVGNHFDIPNKTLLNVIQPNGGELLTPCWYYPIKWTGHVHGLYTKLYYSTNGGYSWNYIDAVSDSVYNWKVPQEVTATCLIKAKQDFSAEAVFPLIANDIPVTKFNYSGSSIEILSLNKRGELLTWDLTQTPPQLAKTRQLTTLNYPYFYIQGLGINYFDNDQKFVVAYNSRNLSYNLHLDTLAFYNTDEDEPYLKLPVPNNFESKEMKMDRNGAIITFIPELGSRLMNVSTTDGSFIKYVDFDKPISDFAFSSEEDKAVVSFYDGNIKILSVPDFNEIDSFTPVDIPVIKKVQISPNGSLIGIGCMSPLTTTSFKSNTAERHTWDVKSGQIVRTIKNSASDPTGMQFDPSSSYILIGSEFQPQISLWTQPSNERETEKFQGHEGPLTDMKIAPDGHSITTSADSYDNMYYMAFTYPEQDSSDAVFSIGRPEISTDTMNIDPQFLATANEFYFEEHLCNHGNVPLIMDENIFAKGVHFRLAEPITPDTIFPDQCMTIPLVFNPLDTGFISDSLIFSSCMGNYLAPIHAFSKPRNITFLKDAFEFGESCVGESVEREIELARNDDPVPLYISSIFIHNFPDVPFEILTPVRDTIIQPGGIIKLRIRFTPDETGPVECKIVIYHNDLEKFKVHTLLRGTGIGTTMDISHPNLMFIPEISKRTITITNTSTNDVTIEDFETNPDGYFKALNLPIVIPVGEDGVVELEWNGQEPPQNVTLSFHANPCATTNDIMCGLYDGTSKVTIEGVEADPKGEAIIPIKFVNTENFKYDGPRFFEAEIKMNPRMFFPTEALSDYGEAEIVKNEVVNDERIIRVRATGNFNQIGTAVNIKGVAGLAETDKCDITFSNESIYWGSAVEVESFGGQFELINLNGSRRIILNDKPIMIQAIAPNPISDKFSVEVNATEDDTYSVKIYDALGAQVKDAGTVEIKKGINTIPLNVSGLQSGNYKIMISNGSDMDAGTIMVVK